MNFQFSEEAEALRDEARKFLAAESAREKARAVMNGDATHDAALWSRIAELGWTAHSRSTWRVGSFGTRTLRTR